MTASTSDAAALLAQVLLLAGSASVPAVPEPRATPDRVLLTVEEAAERLGIGRTSAWRLIRTRELESVRIGTLRRVPTTAVVEYAARLVQQSRETSHEEVRHA
jgi:excisionase family DNA binding protein